MDLKEKYKHFNNDQIYILHRALMEASYDMINYYSLEEVKIYDEILNEVVKVRQERGI